MWAVFGNVTLPVAITDFIENEKDCSSKIENAGEQRPNSPSFHHFCQYGVSYHSFVVVFVILQMRGYI